MTAEQRRTRDDASLIDQAELAFRAFLDGDRERMGDLVDLLTPLLWQLARSQGASHAAAQDVVQVAWTRLVRHAENIEDPRAVAAWLMTTVRREAQRTVQRDRREDRPLDEAVVDVSDDALGPEGVTLDAERAQVLWQHVQGLDERCQALLRVVAFAQRPDYAAISAALGMPVGSIGPTRGRCLEKLRRRLLADDRWVWEGHRDE